VRGQGIQHDWSPRITGATALAVFFLAFLFRWITIDFDNDYFMHMAWAAEMVRGSAPVRDFVEPGFPAQTLLAYIGLELWGHQLVWEAAIACGFIAAGITFTFLVCRRIGIPLWLALVATTFAAAMYPRLYAYPKAFVYPAALYALAIYLQTSSRRALIALAGITALAFLFRHDHGVWIAIVVTIALLLYHWRESKTLVRALSTYGAVAALLVSPWLVWVAASGHSDQYLAFLFEQSGSLATRDRIPERGFIVDRSKPLVMVAPRDEPTIGIRWAPQTTDASRERIEAQYGLEPAGAENEYRLSNASRDNVQALLLDPSVEDTRGIDRSTLRVPPGVFKWLYVQTERYLPFVRLRVLPGIVNGSNTESWLAWVSFGVPWLVVVIALIRRFVYRNVRGSERLTMYFIVPTAVLGAIGYQMLVRGSTDSRLGDVAPVTAILIAWMVMLSANVRGHRAWILQPAVAALLSVTMAGAFSYGRVLSRIDEAGVDGPRNLVRRAVAQVDTYENRPLDVFAPPGADGLARISRWINACTAETDRVAVIGFEPQVFFLSERGFAGGVAFYDLGWSTSEPDQRLAIERWSRQRVPIVVAVRSEWKSFSNDHRLLREWLDEHYQRISLSTFDGNKELSVLVDTSYAPAGTHPDTGLPCYR
jgi:hypothetical protein